MARLTTRAKASGHSILIVDDDSNLVATLEMLLRQEGHSIFTASNGPEALKLCREQEIHLMLLDYFMPGMTGEDVVRELRQYNTETQIMLQTGYASDKPPRQMLRELDIQAYHDKSEGPEKLLVLVDAALKAFRHIRTIKHSHDGLKYILEVSPQLHRLQPLEDLLQGVLMQIQGLMGYAGTLLATLDQDLKLERDQTGGLIATTSGNKLEVRMATGRFYKKAWEDLSQSEHEAALQALMTGRVQRDSLLALPLSIAERSFGVILVDHQLEAVANVQLLELFTQQAAVAIENVKLYELATVDDLTKTFVKRHWLHQFDMAQRLALRHGHPLSLIILDVDHFKRLNDSFGHLAGDLVLKALGQVLLEQMRKTDILGRFGGEELIIALPHTDHHGALSIAEKLRLAIEQFKLEWQSQILQVTVSMGVATLEPGKLPFAELASETCTELTTQLIATADAALYDAKRNGRNRVASKTFSPSDLEPA